MANPTGEPALETVLRVLVVGTGGVGGYYGALLARAGHDVTFVARGAHGRAIRDSGLAVETPSERIVVKAPCLDDVSEARGLGADVALVAVKASGLREVSAGTGAALGDGGVAIPLLNGLDSEAELAAAIGKERVVGGVAQIAARVKSPGVVLVEAPGSIVLAPLDPSDLPRAERLARLFAAAGFACEAKRDLARVLWTKLLWNAPFNAICALTRRTAGEALDSRELTALLQAAMAEVVAVANAEGVALDSRMIEPTLEATRARFRATVPSMLQDVLAGRRTEARALQGAVVALGAKHGVPTPIHSTLFALVLGLERSVLGGS